MKLNLFFMDQAPPIELSEEGNQLPLRSSRSGKKNLSDSRPKLSSTRSITHEYVHAYLVNDAPTQEVPKTPKQTSNPDVSGYVSQACRTPPRETSVGIESLKGALAECNWNYPSLPRRK